jgi:hypothetical protein
MDIGKGARVDGTNLIIPINPNSTQLSATGKSHVLATSNGFIWQGNIGYSWNVVKRI